MAHFMASKDALVPHLLADTGNKNKHLRRREEFVPVTDVKVRIRVPRAVRQGLSNRPENGWLNLTIPRVLIHEAVLVQFA